MADTRHLRGLDKALASLRRLRADAAPALVAAMNKSVEEMAERSRALSPDATGNLDLQTDTDAGARNGRFFARVFVSKGAFYGRFVEFGTVKMGARPFFWPAVRSLQKRARNRVNRALRLAARKAVRGG